jgi:hypothetical protein
MRRAVPILVIVAACGGSTSSSSNGGGFVIAPSFFVRDVITPPVASGNGCLYSSDPSQPTLSSGTLDVMFATKYAPAILVGNTAPPDGGDGARGAITGFDVTVTDAGGATIGSFHSDAAGFVDGAYGGTPSYAAVTATLLDDATAAVARTRMPDAGTTRVIAHAAVTGKSASGNPVKSIPFDFPIDLCDGCLISFPPDVGPTRSGCGMTPTNYFPQPCVVGQDQAIDCRLCYATHPACRP